MKLKSEFSGRKRNHTLAALCLASLMLTAPAVQAEKVVVIPLGGSTTYIGATIFWTGAWRDNFQYVLGDGMQHGGSSYICVRDHVSSADNTPPNETYWSLMAEKGGVKGDPVLPDQRVQTELTVQQAQPDRRDQRVQPEQTAQPAQRDQRAQQELRVQTELTVQQAQPDRRDQRVQPEQTAQPAQRDQRVQPEQTAQPDQRDQRAQQELRVQTELTVQQAQPDRRDQRVQPEQTAQPDQRDQRAQQAQPDLRAPVHGPTMPATTRLPRQWMWA